LVSNTDLGHLHHFKRGPSPLGIDHLETAQQLLALDERAKEVRIRWIQRVEQQLTTRVSDQIGNRELGHVSAVLPETVEKRHQGVDLTLPRLREDVITCGVGARLVGSRNFQVESTR